MADDQEKYEMLKEVCQRIYDKKGFNIIALDVRGVSTLTDFFVIAEGNVEKHVQALSKHTYDLFEQKGIRPLHIEGESAGDWVVLDAGDVIVHIFRPEIRSFYNLEKIWSIEVSDETTKISIS